MKLLGLLTAASARFMINRFSLLACLIGIALFVTPQPAHAFAPPPEYPTSFTLATATEFVPAESLSNASETTGLERISFSRRTDGAGHVIRIHLSEKVAGHSVPSLGPKGEFSITLFRSHIDQNRILDDPILPVASYEIEQVNKDVIVRLALVGLDFNVSAYRDRDSDDILISVSSTSAPNLPLAQSATSSERWTLDTIVIDAGHGGKDTGAVGRNGLREKDVVLAVALKVGEYLRQNLGVNVIFTRDTDEFISLQGRGHLANQVGAKLFVSIHANSAPDSRASGTETFFLGLHKSEAAKRVMDRENEVIRFEEDPSTYERIDARVAVMQTLAQSAYMRQSQFLADLVEGQFEERVGRKSRGVKQAGFYVLYGASMPSILVELGFISNANEAAFMGSPDGQAYLASAIYRAISDYKTEYDKDLQLSAFKQK
ncbi:N-acetylmuramoyl-L-alanine amidase [bacterium]|nr:N-acetylmuramoyl-L-alanine amidase [bacterium]